MSISKNNIRRAIKLFPIPLLTALLFANHSYADDELIEEVVSIGSRSIEGRTLTDSPVPVDLITADDMASTGATEVGRMLQMLAPSFNFSSSTISDGTDALRPATLRGLGPDQTLVLVNGKRRHNSALIHMNTSVGRGTAGTDLNAIPVSSIKKIEILRDGAAAQYGSDAIAGVINIVLKDDQDAGTLHASYGEYSEGDGESLVVSANKGFAIGSDGYLNLSAEFRDRGRTNRAGLTGVCQYIGTCTELADGSMETSDPREIAFNRQNFRIGDGESTQQTVVANFGMPLSGNMEIYSAFTYSNRDNTSGGFYRRANQSGNNPSEMFDGTPIAGGDAFYPDGFLPLINTTIDDFSLSVGLMGEFGTGWSWDLNLNTGKNDFSFDISNSVNASLVSATGTSPTSAFAGELGLGLTTLNFEMVKETDWGLIAWGAGYKEDTYSIDPGEEVSYEDYDTTLGVANGINDAAGGIQVFPGFKPSNMVDESRDAISLYVDSEFNATENLTFSVAARLEDYSDFGSTATAKGTFSFHASDMFTLRGAASTGFRAPSMQQQYFNNVSTQFNGGVAEDVGTFRNDSFIAQELGLPALKEETSVNTSVGFILEPHDDWTITTDLYRIDIEDRIVLSGRIGPTGGEVPSIDQAFTLAGVASAQFFLNAADTETSGIDFVVTNKNELSNGASLNFTLSANYTETEVTDVKSPDSLSSVSSIQNLVFTEQDQSILEEWQPQDRINFNTNYRKGPMSINLSFNRYGEYTVLDSGSRQTFGAKILTDFQFSYDLTDSLTWNLGGNNIFDEMPDINTIGQSRTGTIVDTSGTVVVETEGVFQYSRRSAPFGFNGAYFYTSVNYSF